MNRRLPVTLAALLVLGACGSRVDEWPDGALEPSDYYTTGTSLTVGNEDDEGVGDDDTTTATTTVRRKNTRSTDTTSAAAGQLPAPAPGTYTYDETTTAPGFDDEPPESEKAVATETWGVERSASSVTLTLTQTDGDEDFASRSVTTFRVRASALELVKTVFTFEDEAPETCSYEPPALLLKLPLTVGSKWKSKSQCSDAEEDAEEMEFEVTGTANDVIGGKTVNTFIVRSVDSFDSTDDTTGERTTFSFTDTRHIDPATLLTVIEDVRFAIDDDATTIHRQLRSLTPT